MPREYDPAAVAAPSASNSPTRQMPHACAAHVEKAACAWCAPCWRYSSFRRKCSYESWPEWKAESRIGSKTATKKVAKRTEPKIGPPLVPAQKHSHPKLPRSKPVFSKANPLTRDDFNYLLFFPIVKARR
jgi:hypothetical protein